MTQLFFFLQDEAGPTTVEYAVLLAGIIAVCITAITLVGGETVNYWSNNRDQLDSAFTGS